MEATECLGKAGKKPVQVRTALKLHRNTNDRLYVAPNVEITDHLEGTRSKVFLEHIEDLVRYRLVRNALIPEAVQIELQAFKLDYFPVRGVRNLDVREIRIP